LSQMKSSRVALASFLVLCPHVVTVGIRACLDDYSAEEKDLMRSAEKILFPSSRFVDVFRALDIPTFPSCFSYSHQRSRVLQHLLFQYLEAPHPRSRIYFGRKKEEILNDFKPPFLLLGDRPVPDTSHLVSGMQALEVHARKYNPVIIRELVEWSEIVQLVCVNYECIGALRHRNPMLTQDSHSSPLELDDPCVEKLLKPTLELLRKCRLDDILVEWGMAHGKWSIIEMRRPPSKWQTATGFVRRFEHICELIGQGRI
jgi:ribosomal protein S6--L-glutamate ligase